MYDYLKSGRNAIRLIYFLIIGLGITEALRLLFFNSGEFAFPNEDQILLFIVFFSFVSRFFIGAYRVISEDIDIEFRQSKIAIDLIGFCFQALAFYVYALNFIDQNFSQWLIFILCIVDIVWLILLVAFFRIMTPTFSEWMIHNLVIGAFVLLNIYYWQNLYALFAISLLAAIIDFALNYNFYFAFKDRPGLTIFVAGPYGDDKSKEEIATNVETAKEIGKQLALKGHFPFIPHTMLHGWEMDQRFTREHFKRIDFQWLEFCDALYFIGESPGANVEKEIAIKKGLQVFEKMDDVPKVNVKLPSKKTKSDQL